jgi:hypothetical protein
MVIGSVTTMRYYAEWRPDREWNNLGLVLY